MDASSIAIQVPIVAAVLFTVLKLAKDYRADSTARDKHWQEFLKAEREQRRDSMRMGFAEMHELSVAIAKQTESITELARAFVAHDRTDETRFEKINNQLTYLRERWKS